MGKQGGKTISHPLRQKEEMKDYVNDNKESNKNAARDATHP